MGGDGAATGQPSLQRLNADGTIDTGFQAAGPVANGFGVSALAQTPDGKLLVAEYTSDDDETCTLSRLNSDGSLDTAFTPPETLDGDVSALAGDLSGRVIFSGDFTQVNGVVPSGIRSSRQRRQPRYAVQPALWQHRRLAGVRHELRRYRHLRSRADGPPMGSIRPRTRGSCWSAWGRNGSAVRAIRISPCPACELIPNGAGSEVLVQVESDDATADPIFIAPPPSPGGGVVNDLPVVTLQAIRSRVFSGGSRKGKFMLFRSGDLSADLRVPYKIRGGAVAGARLPRPARLPDDSGRQKAMLEFASKPLDGYFPVINGKHLGVKLFLETGADYQIGTPAAARVRIINRQ